MLLAASFFGLLPLLHITGPTCLGSSTSDSGLGFPMSIFNTWDFSFLDNWILEMSLGYVKFTTGVGDKVIYYLQCLHKINLLPIKAH